MNIEFNAPVGAKRLFDLVVPNLSDEEKEQDSDVSPYKVLFYQALHNTLVAEDIDTASDLAYGKDRWKVVTIDGALIESSGVVTGGGQPRKGLIGNKARKSLGKASVEIINDLKLKQNELRQAINELNRNIDLSNSAISEMKNRSENDEVKRFKNNYPKQKREIKDRKVKLEEQLEKSTRTLKKALEKQQQMEDNLKDLIAKSDSSIPDQLLEITQKIESLQEQIDDAMGERYIAQKEEYEALTKQVKDKQDTTNKFKSMYAVGKEELAKSEKEKQEAEQSIIDFKQKLIDLNSKQVAIENDVRNYLEQNEQLQEENKKEEIRYKEIKHKITELQNLMNDHGKKIKEKQESIEVAEKQILEFKERKQLIQ